jgi:Ribonuclease G/E
MQILLGTKDGVTIAAVADGSSLLAVYARPDDDRPWQGDVFAGKVLRYAPGQRAYFLDVGKGVEVFLPHPKATEFAPGTVLMVQVERPASGGKAARGSLMAETRLPPAVGLIRRGPTLLEEIDAVFPGLRRTDPLDDFEHAIDALLQPVVTIQDGLNIIIERTAAFWAVDVNSASGLKPLEANRLAAMALARQMRLRNMRGGVVVDFLRLAEPEQQKQLQRSLAEALVPDPTPVRFGGFTALGHFEMARTATGLSLEEIFACV